MEVSHTMAGWHGSNHAGSTDSFSSSGWRDVIGKSRLTGPSLSRLGPSLQWTARRLWTIYIVLTLIEMILLRFVVRWDYLIQSTMH